MDNFDLRTFLAKNPLNEAYTPGSGWTQDFDYDDMLAQGLKVTVDTPIEDLEKMFADFEDVNYHREGEHLSYAIDAIKAGDRGEAKMHINKFRKEIKKTIAAYSDEYFDVNEGREGQFDVETTEKIAQKVADAFTAEDNELDLKYVVTPGTEENSFDLDVEAGPNTPGEDWKDANGFGIENYLGQYAGGSFYIKDGVVYNAASRNAPVAKVSPEGEVEMISAEESRAAIGMEEEVKEIKSNKMKKSELKEMIRNAFLNETEIEEKESFDDAFDRIDKEEELYPKNTQDPKSQPGYISEEEDKEEVEVDAEEIDVDTDAETADAGEVDVEADAKVEMTGDKKEIQDNLQAALEAAKALGDQKLVDQIGNSITFFTRTHVVGKGEVAEADVDVEVNSPVEDAEVGMDLEEGAADNLELKSIAKKVYLGFKQMGADVQLSTTNKTVNPAKATPEVYDPNADYGEDLKDVWVYVNNDSVNIVLVGDKAISYADGIKKSFSQFEWNEYPHSTWKGKKTLNLTVTPGKTTSESLDESINRMKKLAGLIK